MKSEGDTGEMELYYQMKENDKVDMYLAVGNGEYQLNKDVPYTAETVMKDGMLTEEQTESEKALKEAFEEAEEGIEESYWFSKDEHALIKIEIDNTPLAIINYYVNQYQGTAGGRVIYWR